MKHAYRWLCSIAVAGAMAACGGDADQSATLQETIDSVVVENPDLAEVSNENALGAVRRALMHSMERAELLEERAQDAQLRDLARAIREERAALIIAVNEEAGRVGVQLDPPADSVAAVTAGRELRQEHEAVLERLRGMEPAAFDTAFVAASAEASLEAAEELRTFDAAALAPGVLEQVRATAASLTWEADELSGVARDTTAADSGA